MRGGLRTDQRRLDEGLRDLDAALALTPWNPLSHTLRAMNLCAQGRHDDALVALDLVRRHGPDEGRDAMLRGWFLVDAKRNAEALPVLERASELVPDNADVWGNLGIALHLLGRHDEALPALERAIALNPDLGPALTFHERTLRALRGDAEPPDDPAPTAASQGMGMSRLVGFSVLALAVLILLSLLIR